MSRRHNVGLASIVLFPVVGALRLANIVEAVPYTLVAGAAVLFLVYSLVEPKEPREPPRDPQTKPSPPRSLLLH